ncbi:MAG: hypothetical protein NTU94_15810 [Planctomycetota bacterium]|nr:hypothetical protein [Planctomycetota bacterium]
MGREHVSEVDDIHPILRANPFLVEEGARLVRGEAFPKDDTLKRIDLALQDSKGVPLYVEVKWNGFDQQQVDDYVGLLRSRYGERPFRLMWFVPEDVCPQVNDPRIEVNPYSREFFMQMLEVREEARAAISSILNLLGGQVVVPKSLMYGEEVIFPNIISACYFDGRVETERGLRQIGLRKQGIGRALDTVRCVCQCPYACYLPELTVPLVQELLFAPAFFENRGQGTVDSQGIIGMIRSHKSSGFYKTIAEKTEAISALTCDITHRRSAQVKHLYGDDPSKSDLLYRVLLASPKEIFQLQLIVLRPLLQYLTRTFCLTPTEPLRRINHTKANRWVENSVCVAGYENDFAKRLVELAVLKRHLLPVGGVGVMTVLTMNQQGGKKVFERTPVQNVHLNEDPSLVRPIV